jgi:hypothetical protein
MHIRDFEKRRGILNNHMLLQTTEEIDNIVFTCSICNMLIEHDKWQDDDEEEDVAAAFQEYSMDQTIVDLRRGPTDRSYVGSGNIDDCNVELECEWTQLRGALIPALLWIE